MLSIKGRFIRTHCFYTTFISLFIFLFVISAFGEGGVGEIWVDRYDGPGNFDDNAYAITVDASGNVYVTGRSHGSGTSYDYATIKYSPSGDTLWVRRYDGPGSGDDMAHALALDESGNVYVTGRSQGSGTTYDYATIKYSSAGDTLWVRRYNGPSNGDDYAVALAVDNSGNVYVTGESYGGETLVAYATIKYSSAGDTLWVRRYNGSGNFDAQARALAVDDSGNVYVTGRSATIKYLPNGDSSWVRSYGIDGQDLAVDDSGNVYVTGRSWGGNRLFGGTDDDYATIKYSSAGDTLWLRRYNNAPLNFADVAKALAVAENGDVYVTGSSDGNNGPPDFATIKYSSAGNTLWVNRYGNDLGNPRYDAPTDLVVDDSGNVYVTGWSQSCCSGSDYTTIKYSSAGDSLWLERYNGPSNGDDGANAIALDKSGNLYVTGESYGSGITYITDYSTIKYSPCTAKAGDANKDDNVNLSDIIFLVNLVFKAGLPLSPLCRSDINASGGNPNLSDIIYLVNHIFKAGPDPKNSGVCCL